MTDSTAQTAVEEEQTAQSCEMPDNTPLLPLLGAPDRYDFKETGTAVRAEVVITFRMERPASGNGTPNQEELILSPLGSKLWLLMMRESITPLRAFRKIRTAFPEVTLRQVIEEISTLVRANLVEMQRRTSEVVQAEG